MAILEQLKAAAAAQDAEKIKKEAPKPEPKKPEPKKEAPKTEVKKEFPKAETALLAPVHRHDDRHARYIA